MRPGTYATTRRPPPAATARSEERFSRNAEPDTDPLSLPAALPIWVHSVAGLGELPGPRAHLHAAGDVRDDEAPAARGHRPVQGLQGPRESGPGRALMAELGHVEEADLVVHRELAQRLPQPGA